MAQLISESDPKTIGLRARMDEFYSNFRGYNAFQAVNSVDHFWPLLLPWIAVRSRSDQPALRVLEFGAGRTGFPDYLKAHALRTRVDLTLHDVTHSNADWLLGIGNAVQFGPVSSIEGTFDLIFSSFVLEHMTDPSSALSHLWSLLAPGGAIFLICPCYDWPFYLPPSCDHLPAWSRWGLSLRLLSYRFQTLLTHRPAFLLLDDLAMFHLPWQQDRDAVHLVSALDMRYLFGQLGGHITRLRSLWGGGAKDWVVKRQLQLCVRIDRPI